MKPEEGLLTAKSRTITSKNVGLVNKGTAIVNSPQKVANKFDVFQPCHTNRKDYMTNLAYKSGFSTAFLKTGCST